MSGSILWHGYRRLAIVVLAVLVIGLAGVGCGGQPESEPTEPTEGAEEPQEQTPRLLRFTLANVPKIDPAIGSDGAAAHAHLNLYDTLVFPQNDGSVVPHVAESWEMSDDGMVYTFHLKSGIKFHSGEELTADDVVFSLNRLLAVGRGWAYLFQGRVEKAEAVDSHTVKFTLTEPYGPFLTTLVRLYILNEDEVMANKKEGDYGESGDYATDWLITHDAGSGPYKVKEMKVGEKLVVEAFADYWAGLGPNAPTEAHMIGTTEPVTVRTMMSRRELEMSDSYQPMENLQAMDNIEGVDLALLPGGSMTDLMVNTKIAPTDDVHIRKALAYAIDYDTIVNQIYPGNPAPTGMLCATLAGFKPYDDPVVYDLERAKSELEQSKYYDQISDLPITIAWVAEVPDREKIALLVQANLTELGVNIEVERVPWTSMVERAVKPDTTPHISIVSYQADYPEAGAILDARWHSRGAGTWLQMDHLLNSDIDAMIDDALATSDWDTRMEKYKAIQEEIEALQPSIPLMESMTRQAYQAEYVVWPAAEAVSAGKPASPYMGYNFYLADIEVYPDKMPK